MQIKQMHTMSLAELRAARALLLKSPGRVKKANQLAALDAWIKRKKKAQRK